jgi:hypothetical protein
MGDLTDLDTPGTPSKTTPSRRGAPAAIPEETRRLLAASALLHQLEEFQHGYGRLCETVLDGDESGSVRIRYHVVSLKHYIASWLLLAPGENPPGGFLRPALDGMGVDAEIAAVDAALQAPVGTTALGEAILHTRNRVSVHPKTLVAEEIIANAEAKIGASNEELSEEFPGRFHDLCEAVLALEGALRARMPLGLIPPDSQECVKLEAEIKYRLATGRAPRPEPEE